MYYKGEGSNGTGEGRERVGRWGGGGWLRGEGGGGTVPVISLSQGTTTCVIITRRWRGFGFLAGGRLEVIHRQCSWGSRAGAEFLCLLQLIGLSLLAGLGRGVGIVRLDVREPVIFTRSSVWSPLGGPVDSSIETANTQQAQRIARIGHPVLGT
jgi:hypothetical protein